MGTKIDLVDERKISQEEAQNLAKSYKMQYFETSAKENKGINELFETLLNRIYKIRTLGRQDSFKLKAASTMDNPEETVQRKKAGCCWFAICNAAGYFS